MSPGPLHRTPIRLLLLLLLLGCSEEPTAPVRADLLPAEDLSFTFAYLDPAALVDFEHTTLEPTGPGPAASDTWGEDLPASASIRDARTMVGLSGISAYAYGEHRYTGNKGRIETTVDAAFSGQHLGERTAIRQQSEIFLLDFGRIKHIWAIARIYTDKQCGLEAHGRSSHSAWWEFYQGVAAPVWGEVVATSDAPPDRQEPCARRDSPYDPTGSYDSSGGGMTCTYLITYDLDTGQIYDVTLLFCSSGTLL
jgi:hypothetical protein